MMCIVYELNSLLRRVGMMVTWYHHRSMIHRVQPADSPAASWC
ncbi:hypothetical protein [Klebsiella phage pKP-BM327-1.2]|nr:hypothetical protein [Klebsiella phage pKP-BM327-1.2]